MDLNLNLTEKIAKLTDLISDETAKNHTKVCIRYWISESTYNSRFKRNVCMRGR